MPGENLIQQPEDPPPEAHGHPAEKGANPFLSGLKEVKHCLDSSQTATSFKVRGPGLWTIPEITQPIPVMPIKVGAKYLKGIKI